MRSLRVECFAKVASDTGSAKRVFLCQGRGAARPGSALAAMTRSGLPASGGSWRFAPPHGFDTIVRVVVQAGKLDTSTSASPLERNEGACW